MTEAMHGELLAVIGMAAETNRLADALRVPLDRAFEEADAPGRSAIAGLDVLCLAIELRPEGRVGPGGRGD